MDKAPDFGSGDCRFESCHGRNFILKGINCIKFTVYLLIILFLNEKSSNRKCFKCMNKLGYFYVTAKSIIMEGYQQINSLGWEMAEMLAVTNKAILMELKNFCCLDTAIILTWGFSQKKFQFNQLRNGWDIGHRVFKDSAALHGMLQCCRVTVLTLWTWSFPSREQSCKISTESIEKWLRYWQLKVCVVVGGFQCIAWSQPCHVRLWQ